MEQKDIVNLGTKIFIYQSLFEALDEKTQTELRDIQMINLEKYEKAALTLDKLLNDNITGVEVSVINYVKLLLEDIDKTILSQAENAVE